MNGDDVIESLTRLLGEPVVGVQKIGAGGNSRVYRVDVRNGPYAAKHYFQRTSDGRDRLEAEFGGLQFLWSNNVRCIPQPLAADRQRQLAVYQYIRGREISVQNVTAGDIDQLAVFLAALRQLTAAPAASNLNPAAEASFTVVGIVHNIHARLDLLLRAADEQSAQGELKRFLEDQFIPAFSHWELSARQTLGEIAYATPLPVAARTLSPSDFGFHNALRGDNNQLTFLDFEYFGWDDPAKLISDFLWHPRSIMANSLKDHFVRRMMTSFRDIPDLATRLEAVFPLFGLKWCMILLNEFRPENLKRRRFASGSTEETEAILALQLGKAKNTLERVNRGTIRFS